MTPFIARGLLALLKLLQRLPLSFQADLGLAIGELLYRLAGSRRRIALRNVELCRPDLSPRQRRALVREHFGWLGRSLLERGLLWYASPKRLANLIQIEGDIDFAANHPAPVMWLVPHFVGLDIAGVAVLLLQQRPLATIYQAQSNPVFDEAMRAGRSRFGKAKLFSRSETALPLVRAIRSGAAFFNLPDMDFGARDAAFVPFFGIPAATLLAPARMARSMRMAVQPVLAEMLPGGEGYRVRFLPPLEDFPGDDSDEAATARMNRWIEAEILRLPAQYLWVHRRFKTRPPGQPSLY
jgi:KDO2-lipid IV(A) lauroyltransferase